MPARAEGRGAGRRRADLWGGADHWGRAAWALLGVSAAIWLAAWQPWRWYMGDLIVYRTGSEAVLHGRHLYSVTGGVHHLHFTYPPFAAALFAPLAWLPLPLARVAITAASIVGLVACARIVIARLGERTSPYRSGWLALVLAVSIWLEPVRASISFGQVDLVLMALVTVDLLAMRSQRRAGWLTGLAAAVKLTPLAFIVFLFVVGRRRPALNAVASFVGCGLIGLLCAPHASMTYWGHPQLLSARRVGRVENASNQSLHGILARLLRTTSPPSWWILPAAAVLGLGLIVARRLYRAGEPVWSLTVMALTTLVVSPVSWSHHWVWCVPMLLACVDLVRRRLRWRAALSVVAMLPFATALVFWAPHADHLELHDTAWQQLASASYPLAAVAFTAVLAASLRVRSGTGRRDHAGRAPLLS